MTSFYHKKGPYIHLIYLIDHFKIVSDHVKVTVNHFKSIKRDHFEL